MIVWEQAALGCGVRIDGPHGFQRRRALYAEWSKGMEAAISDGNSEMPRTPSERLRFMLSSGHQLQHMFRGILDKHPKEGMTTYLSLRQLSGYMHAYYAEEGVALDEIFVRRMWSAYKWADAGGNQFQVTPDLAAALVLTDVPDISPEEMKLPYETLAFTLPPGTIPFAMPDEGVKQTEWADTLWIEKVDEGEYLWIIRWRELELHHLFSAKTGEWFRVESEEALVSDDEMSFAAAYKLVRNFALWLHAEGAAEMKRARVDVPKKLAEKRAKSGEAWPKQWLFGKEVKISPELRRAAMESVLGRSRHSVEGWKVRARFTVRGHWRNQAHGAGMQLRTRKWIAPYWKGPAEKEAWAHIYKPVVK